MYSYNAYNLPNKLVSSSKGILYMYITCDMNWLSGNFISLYPRCTEGGMGAYWIHPNVCPSVRPSVDN